MAVHAKARPEDDGIADVILSGSARVEGHAKAGNQGCNPHDYGSLPPGETGTDYARAKSPVTDSV